MASVQEHYDHHLGPIYGWMLGDFDLAVQDARTELDAAGVRPGAGERAVDLGAGNGAGTLALADLGYDVVAVDTCARLLDELKGHAQRHAVTTLLGDATALPALWDTPAAVVTCMGDTLTHLASFQAVERLLERVAAALAPGGTFVATLRDASGPAPQGSARFIPVRADDDRILTCFLEVLDDIVLVHDILHEKQDGRWRTSVSAYPKLRLQPERARLALAGAGLDASIAPTTRGMVRLVGRKPGGPAAAPTRSHASARTGRAQRTARGHCPA